MSNKRPKIKLELTLTDKILELLSWIFITIIWVLTIINYKNLPNIIPIHYNYLGEADRFSGKENIFLLPLILIFIFALLTILNKFPHLFNYPVNITEDNALENYINATRLNRYLKLIIIIIFGLIEFQTIRMVNNQTNGLGSWFLPLMLVLTFIPIILFMKKSFKTIKK